LGPFVCHPAGICCCCLPLPLSLPLPLLSGLSVGL
jgi:hypothetical protein